MMKQAEIPRIEGLETMTFSRLCSVMDQAAAQVLIDCQPWSEQFPCRPDVKAALAASQTHLFILFTVCGEGLKASYGLDQQPVWQDSCVEFFVGAPDGCGYRNFEMNCIGTMLSAYQRSRGVGAVRTPAGQLAQVIRHTTVARATFDERHGVHTWRAAMGIPFTVMGFAEGLRPRMLKANLYKCADGSATPHYLSWSPIDTPSPDFHRPDFFGTFFIN